MIEPLKIDKLREYGFGEEDIDSLLDFTEKELYLKYGYRKIFWASNVEKAIYSGIDAARKWHLSDGRLSFPEYDLDLIPEYYSLLLQNFLNQRKIKEGIIYDEHDSTVWFKNNIISEIKREITLIETDIEKTRLSIKQASLQPVFLKPLIERKEQRESYLKWLGKPVENKEANKVEQLVYQFDTGTTDKNGDKIYSYVPQLFDPKDLEKFGKYLEWYSAMRNSQLPYDVTNKEKLIANETHQSIVNHLTEWFLGSAEFQSCFTTEAYHTAIIAEGNYIEQNLGIGEIELESHLLYKSYTQAQRFVILTSLMDYIAILVEFTEESIELYANAHKSNYSLNIRKEQLTNVLSLTKRKVKEIHNQRKYHFDEFRKSLSNLSDSEKITYYKQAIVECDNDERKSSYPFYFNQFIKNCETEIEKIKIRNQHNPDALPGPTLVKAKPQNQFSTEDFYNFFIIEHKEIFTILLKDTFPIEKGKQIRLLIEALKELKIVAIDSRSLKRFVLCMAAFFKRDIGSYQSINDFKNFEDDAHESDFTIVKNKVEVILKRANRE